MWGHGTTEKMGRNWASLPHASVTLCQQFYFTFLLRFLKLVLFIISPERGRERGRGERERERERERLTVVQTNQNNNETHNRT